ncbi:MAG: sulfur carrier protein ThiS [Bryobacteraceae bacterium]
MSTNAQIEIVVNGEIRSIASGQSIRQLLESLQLEPARVAVELDRRIVKPHDWDSTPIGDGAKLEIVQFVGGG